MNLDSRIEFCKQLAIREAVEYLQPILKQSYDAVLREFVSSKTYDLIQNTATRMWAESGGYIGEWYLEEKARVNAKDSGSEAAAGHTSAFDKPEDK